MSKKSRFRPPFDKEHRKRTKALSKSLSQHIYHIHSLLPSHVSWKKSLLLKCKILLLLVKALAADENYPVLNRDNLKMPIQMQLSKKQKSFSEFLLAFLKSTLDFKHFEKKMTLIGFVFLKLRTPKTWLYKCLKSPVSEDPSKSNMADVPKHCWNLHHTIFIVFIGPCQVNWVGKSLSYWHAKSWYYLLTHWLSMTSILFLIKRIYWYQFRWNYFRNKKLFLRSWLQFCNLD